MNNIFFFCPLWCDLLMIFTCDFVTHESHWQITSLETKKSLFKVTHALFYISVTMNCFEIIHVKLHINLPGAIELTQFSVEHGGEGINTMNLKNN